MTIAYLEGHATKRHQARSRAVHGRVVPAHRQLSPSLASSVGAGARLVPRSLHVAPQEPVDACAPRSQVARTSEASRVRLTRRGRLVFGAVLVLLVLVVFSLGRLTAGAEAAGPPLHVTVQAGDTVWSIAQQAAPGADPRVEVDRIVSANRLRNGAVLSPGAVLLVPRG